LPIRRIDRAVAARGADAVYEVVDPWAAKQPVATTMAFVRLLKDLMKDKRIGADVRADHPRRGAHLRDGLPVPHREDRTPRTGRPTSRWTAT
jgi:hypothetical protein